MKKLFAIHYLLFAIRYLVLTIAYCLLPIAYLQAYSYLGSSAALGDMSVGQGLRSAAMGGAGIGGSDEPSTLLHNPATMNFLERRQISAGFGFVPFTERVSTSDKRTYYNESTNFQINNFAAVLPFREGMFAVGFAYAPLYDYNYKHTQNIFSQAAPATKIGYKELDASGGIHAMSPAVSVKLGDLFSLGLSYNIIGGTLKRKTHEIDTTGTSAVIKYSTSITANVSGGNINFGLVFTGVGPLRIGLNYYGQSSVNLKEKNETTNVTTDRKIALPGYIGFGVAWDFGGMRNTKLAFDVLPIPYSGAKVDDVKIGLSDITVLKMGVEHFVQEDIPFRFGFYSLPFYADRKIELVAFTLGVGYKLSENVFFDIMGEYGKRNFFGDNLFFDSKTSVDESFKKLMFGANYKW